MDADAVQQEQSPHLMPAALHLSSVFLDVFLEHALNTSNVAEHGAEPAVSDEQLSRLEGLLLPDRAHDHFGNERTFFGVVTEILERREPQIVQVGDPLLNALPASSILQRL